MILDKSAKILNEGKRNVSTNGAKAIKKPQMKERKRKEGKKEGGREGRKAITISEKSLVHECVSAQTCPTL